MTKALVISTAALIALLPRKPLADVSISLIEYRVLGPLGQVRLTRSVVHDPQLQQTMLGRLSFFDQQGLILVAGDSVRQFTRHEMLGSHTIETTIQVYPATGHGYRGGTATAGIVVTIDGKKKIDCPYSAGPVDLADVGILPIDGLISITGSYNDKRIERLVFLNGDVTIDLEWLQRSAE